MLLLMSFSAEAVCKLVVIKELYETYLTDHVEHVVIFWKNSFHMNLIKSRKFLLRLNNKVREKS